MQHSENNDIIMYKVMHPFACPRKGHQSNPAMRFCDEQTWVPTRLKREIGEEIMLQFISNFRVAPVNDYRRNTGRDQQAPRAPASPQHQETPTSREATPDRTISKSSPHRLLNPSRRGEHYVQEAPATTTPPTLPRPPTLPPQHTASAAQHAQLLYAPTVDATWTSGNATPRESLSHEVYCPCEMRAALAPHFLPSSSPSPPYSYPHAPAYEPGPLPPCCEYPAPTARRGARYHPYRRASHRAPQVPAPTMQWGSYVEAAPWSDVTVGGPYAPTVADRLSGGVFAAQQQEQWYDPWDHTLCWATLARQRQVDLPQFAHPVPFWVDEPDATCQPHHVMFPQYSDPVYRPGMATQPYWSPASHYPPYPSLPVTSATTPWLNSLSSPGDRTAQDAPFDIAREPKPLSGRVAHDSAAPSFAAPYPTEMTGSASPWEGTPTNEVLRQDHDFATSTYNGYARPLLADDRATELYAGEATDSAIHYLQCQEAAQFIAAGASLPIAQTSPTAYGAFYDGSDDVTSWSAQANSHY